MILTIFLLTSCTVKYQIRYDLPKAHAQRVKLSEYKLGVLLFNDERPPNETIARHGDTAYPDVRFQEKIPVIIQDLIAKHFQSKLGESTKVVKLQYQSKEINENLLNTFKSDGIDLVLTGNIRHYLLRTKDDMRDFRALMSVLMAVTVVGIVCFPLICIGNVDEIVNIEFERVTIFNVKESQILYQNSYKKTNSKEFPFIEWPSQEAVDYFYGNVKEVIETMYTEVEKSAEYDFPEQITTEKSKKIIKIHYN